MKSGLKSGWFGRHSCAQKMNLIDPNSASSTTMRLTSLALSKCLTNYCLNYYVPLKMSQLSGGDSITWHLHQIIILIDLKKIKQNE